MLPSIARPSLFDGHKPCSKCQTIKPYSDYAPHNTCRGGVNSICRSCERERRRARIAAMSEDEYQQWRKRRNVDKRRYNATPRAKAKRKAHYEARKNSEWYLKYKETTLKKYSRANYLKVTFNITVADYDRMVSSQNNHCAACGCAPDSENSGCKYGILEVDHDHQTGKIRGLLCGRCNRGLGQFQDSVIRLEQAVTYLRRFQ